MAIDLTQERVDFIRAYLLEYEDATNAEIGNAFAGLTGRMWLAAKRTALAHSPVIAQPRIVPDSECVQSRCANATTGCRDSCDLKPGGVLHNAFVVAPVACAHRIVDARNPVITSGYLCLDCGGLFAAADHDRPKLALVSAEGLTDADRINYIERRGVAGSVYQGVGSVDTIVHLDEYRHGGLRWAIDCMIERETAAADNGTTS